jgi:S-DNA-T family DNA segregation ATPase FtsK/SpoIIIE
LGYVLGGWFVFIMWWLVIWLSPPIVAWVELAAPFLYVGFRLSRRWIDHGPKRVPAKHLRRWPRGVARALAGEMKIRKWEKVADGVRLAVAIRTAGASFRALAPVERSKREAEYARMLGGRDVTISPDARRGDWGYLTVHRLPTQAEIDWLADVGQWPGAEGIHRPIPIGLDEKGRVVTVTMLYNNLLIGGIPGAGKSVAMAMIMATAALDPTVELWTLDGGGGVEMRVWKDRASRAESKHAPGFLMLCDLKSEVDRRLEDLMAGGRMKIEPGEPTILLGIEELATFTAKDKKRSYLDGELAGPKDAGETFTEALTYIARLGRKVGVMIVANTQRPSATVVDTDFRDLLGTGLALYCKTGAASDTILGEGWRGQGYNAAKLNRSRKGSFILSPETDTPTRGRCFFLSPRELGEIAARSVTMDDTDDPDGSLAPVDSLAPDTDTDNGDLCLENGENGAAPSEIVAAPSAAPGAAPYVPDAWDLAVLAAATDGRTGPDLYNNLVGGLSAGAARKRLKILTGAGYLSAPPRPKVTDPQLYVTTITGREAIKAESQG